MAVDDDPAGPPVVVVGGQGGAQPGGSVVGVQPRRPPPDTAATRAIPAAVPSNGRRLGRARETKGDGVGGNWHVARPA